MDRDIEQAADLAPDKIQILIYGVDAAHFGGLPPLPADREDIKEAARRATAVLYERGWTLGSEYKNGTAIHLDVLYAVLAAASVLVPEPEGNSDGDPV